jgi:arylsulfatase A-like enzyme
MDVHGPLTPVRAYDSSLYNASPSWSSRAFDGRAVEHGEIDGIRNDIEHHRDLYAAATEYLDRVIDDLVDWLHANTGEETTVVVTADHGENLGYEADRRLFAHRSGLTEGLLHVPLLVLNPPEEMDQTVNEYVSQLRLGELLTGLATGTVPDVTDDVIPAERIGFNVPMNPNATPLRDEDRAIRVAYEGEVKYQWDSLGNRRRYRLDRERPSWQQLEAEDTDVFDCESRLFAVPIDEYRQWVETSSADRTASVDESIEQRLADLGYR